MINLRETIQGYREVLQLLATGQIEFSPNEEAEINRQASELRTGLPGLTQEEAIAFLKNSRRNDNLRGIDTDNQ